MDNQSDDKPVVSKCPHCGASMKMYWHRLNAGLVHALVKVYTRVVEKNENKVSKKEIKLTHSEYGNFQKLRFHALIAKYKENGQWVRGTWLLTHRGAQFLRGEIQIPRKVQTFRNKITAHDEEYVTVTDVIKEQPYWDTAETYIHFADIADVTDAEGKPTPFTFDEKGQGKLV